MKEPGYTEGPEALDKFKKLATAILQAPVKKKKQPRKAASKDAEPKSGKD